MQRCQEGDRIENSYTEQILDCNPDTCSTPPLLLDEVVTPLHESTCSCSLIDMAGRVCCKQQMEVARRDRDIALMLARQYRGFGRGKSYQNPTTKERVRRKG